MLKIFRIALACLLLLAVLPFNDAAAQKKKKSSRTVADSLRQAMLRRDSMMRYYKTSDTSTNNQLQKIEYYTESFNQIANTLNRGLDTVEISTQLPRVERAVKLIRNLISKDRSGTLRYLYAIRDILSHRQDDLDVWQDQLADINSKLIDVHSNLVQIHKDSVFKVFPTDSTLMISFLEQRSALIQKGHKLDSINKKSLLRVGLLQNRVTSAYISIIDQKELINKKIRDFSINALSCEYGYIWNMKSSGNTFKAAFDRTISVNTKLFNLLNGQALTHVLGLLLFVGLFAWIYFNRRRVQAVHEQQDDVMIQAVYAARFPLASALLLTSLIVPFFYEHPPVVFLELIFLISIVSTLILVKRTCPSAPFNYLLKLFVITLLLSVSNLFIEISSTDRIIVLLLAALTVWFSYQFIRHIKISHEQYVPHARKALWLLIILETLSVIFNISGRFSLAKVIGVTALYNFWLALCLYYFVQILVQSLFLQLEANKSDSNNISSYLDFKLLQGKFKSILNIVACVMWFITLLQNLSIEENFFDFIGNFLNQSRALGGTLFTFGSILIFVGVIWLSSVLARIISYIYDFAEQHKARTGNTARKTKTSLLLIRIGIFSVGFLLAVGASGFPLDKITIIISALGVGVGFGLQNIVNNLVSGLILAFEKPVQVGDVIEVANRSGTIKEIGIRSSKIATGNGAEIIIPNGDLISQHVINWTLSDNNRQVELNINVAYGCDIDHVKNLLRDLLSNRDDIMINPAPVVYLNNLSSSSVEFKVFFWAADISMWQQLKSRVLSAVYKQFEIEGIELPKNSPDVKVYLPNSTNDAKKNPPASNQ
ncbi:mechanosensitive ion channel [Mucilaginibacter sp. Bleaf8]|uniref:mechanosensitive ion channel family protein n=1 Tax=Mucilaginibacter sp. Bleaf8 TaxID=2834430 RepID=UPI001BCE7409|nr:mechanosensitive ion channel domain-containing protein [Mucilaginibacter sp. Bleaf8]MBS7563133.1 mechanosensitive ion channel [Mucilaginibacter sp. Bleaf8]